MTKNNVVTFWFCGAETIKPRGGDIDTFETLRGFNDELMNDEFA